MVADLSPTIDVGIVTLTPDHLESATATETPTPTATATILVYDASAATDGTEPSPTPTATKTPLPVFDLWSAKNISIEFDGAVVECEVSHYTPDFDNDFSSPVCALWNDNQGNTGIWIHVGPKAPGTPLLYKIEKDEFGNHRNLEAVRRYMDKMVGRPVAFVVDGVRWNMTIHQIGRFPTWDLEFLKENYLNINAVMGGSEGPGRVILWHCTEAAAGEIAGDDRPLPDWYDPRNSWGFGRIVWVLGG